MTQEHTVGPGLVADPGVLVGYPASRAIADPGFRLGAAARLRSGTVLYAGSSIGANFETGHHVVVREENVIGEDCAIWNGTTIDYGCRLGDRVRIHCSCYVAQFSVLEDDVFLAPGVILGNDIHPGCDFSRQCMRGPVIERGARIGVNVTVLPRVRIGRHALIGAGSVVTRDIPAGAVAFGNPATVRRGVGELRCVTGLTDRPYREEAP
jgi:acetyltransferase-like isoleucine patch superfamily enzyme